MNKADFTFFLDKTCKEILRISKANRLLRLIKHERIKGENQFLKYLIYDIKTKHVKTNFT